jgi:hypothetical protein
MKQKLLVAIACGMMVAGTAFSQNTQSLSFVPSGTVFHQNDTFTVETFLTYSPYSAYGLFYWLETPAGTQNFFTITAETFMVFNDPNQPGWPNNFDFLMTNGVDNGYYATHNDLGAENNPLMAVPPGTYDVSHISFQIMNAAPGVYTFYSTSTSPRPSVVMDNELNDNFIPRASFTITVVPEPATVALLACGAGVLLIALRSRRSWHPRATIEQASVHLV